MMLFGERNVPIVFLDLKHWPDVTSVLSAESVKFSEIYYERTMHAGWPPYGGWWHAGLIDSCGVSWLFLGGGGKTKQNKNKNKNKNKTKTNHTHTHPNEKHSGALMPHTT